MSLTDVSRADGHQSISRAAELLSIVASCHGGDARLSVIAQRSNFHVATTRRILQALVTEGFLAFDQRTKLYTVGPAIFSLATIGSPWFARREIFMPALDKIARKTRDTVLLSIRSGAEAICLIRREGDYPIRVMSLDIGARRPLGAGSGSVAILAFLEPEQRRAVLKANASMFRRYNLSLDDVGEMVEQAIASGFSINRGKIIDGVHGIGVPILAGGTAVASVSVVAVAARMDEQHCSAIVRTIHEALADIPGLTLPQHGPTKVQRKLQRSR